MIHVALFLSSNPYSGGTFQYSESVIQALKALPATEYKVSAIYTNEAWSGILPQEDIKHIHLHPTIADRILMRFFKWIWRERLTASCKRLLTKCHSLGRLLTKQKVTICIYPGQEVFSGIFLIKSIGTIHDLMHRYEPQFPEVSENNIFAVREWSYKIVCSGATAMLVDSKIGKEQVIESYRADDKKIHILAYAAPERELHGDIEFEQSLPERFIFYPAQFWAHKNHVGLVRALSQLNRKDIFLIFPGSVKGAYEEVVRLVKELQLESNVIFLGYISENQKRILYQRAVAMIMPTFFGPTNIPPLEAFQYGCPAAVSNIYGMPEQAGDAALLFDPHQVEEIADAIKQLWDDEKLRGQLIQKGYRRHNEWNQKHFNARLKEIIEEVCNEYNSFAIKENMS